MVVVIKEMFGVGVEGEVGKENNGVWYNKENLRVVVI